MTSEQVIDVGPVALAVAQAGSGGRPLLLLHGYTGAKSDFDDWFDSLAAHGWHVAAPDHRGHGDSDKPAGEEQYSLAIFAADALALADVLGWDRFVLLGHSMGGMIAQEVVLAAPERVEALVLMDTSHAPVAVDPDLLELGVSVARDQGTGAIADLLAEIDNPLETPAHRRLVAEREGYAERGDRNLRSSSSDMYAAMARELTERLSRLDGLATVRVPTLILVGELDEPFVGPSREMARSIPGSRLVVLPDAGHSPQFEAPDAWWAALATFLGEVADDPLVPVDESDDREVSA